MKNLKDIVHNPSTVLVDVRSAWEFESGHLNGAVNIPLEQIGSRATELRNLKAPLVLYCRSGARSGMATALLTQLGLSAVYNGGGIDQLKYLLN